MRSLVDEEGPEKIKARLSESHTRKYLSGDIMGFLFNVLSLLCVSVLSLCRASEPNPPTWPASVEVFSPLMRRGTMVINAA